MVLIISKSLGNPRNPFLRKCTNINNLTSIHLPMISVKVFSYAPHAKGRQVAAFFVAWRPSGTALTLRVRPKCLAPAYTILSPDLVKTLLHLTKILLHLTKFLLTYVPSLYRWQPVARTLICLIFLLFCIIFKNLMQIIHK